MLFVKTEVVSGCLLLKNFKRDLYLMGHKCMYGQIFQCMTWWYVAGMKYVLWCRYFIITFVRNEYQPIWSDFCRAIYIVACLRGFNFVCVCVCVCACASTYQTSSAYSCADILGVSALSIFDWWVFVTLRDHCLLLQWHPVARWQE